jgi:methylmalonyl-CoA/ethylmalonyl-CoA epimerase
LRIDDKKYPSGYTSGVRTAIDHLGVVTDEPARAGSELERLGLCRLDAGIAEDYGVSCEFWAPTGGRDGAMVELVSPIRAGSAVDRPLARRGPGLHHLAIEVDDVGVALEQLRRSGGTPLDQQPGAGARDGMRVAFVYLGRATGLVVELVDYRGPRR